jgi:hypothetical protein
VDRVPLGRFVPKFLFQHPLNDHVQMFTLVERLTLQRKDYCGIQIDEQLPPAVGPLLCIGGLHKQSMLGFAARF